MFNLKAKFQEFGHKVNNVFVEGVADTMESKSGQMMVAGTVGVATMSAKTGGLMAAEDDIFDKLNETGRDLVEKLSELSTVALVLFAVVAFIIKIATRSQRAIDEINTWLRRMFVAWLCIRGVNYFLRFGRELTPDQEIEWTD